MRKVAFEISDNSIQASSSYPGPSVVLTGWGGGLASAPWVPYPPPHVTLMVQHSGAAVLTMLKFRTLLVPIGFNFSTQNYIWTYIDLTGNSAKVVK